MSAAGSPNDAAHAFHRLGRHPGRVGRHQLERWVVMLSEWWVAMTRYAQGKTLTFPSVEPARPRPDLPSCHLRDRACVLAARCVLPERAAGCGRSAQRPWKEKKNVPGSRRCQCFKPQFPLTGSTLWRVHHPSTIGTECHADASSASSHLLSSLQRPMRNKGPNFCAASCSPCTLARLSPRTLNHGAIECPVWCPADQGPGISNSSTIKVSQQSMLNRAARLVELAIIRTNRRRTACDF